MTGTELYDTQIPWGPHEADRFNFGAPVIYLAQSFYFDKLKPEQEDRKAASEAAQNIQVSGTKVLWNNLQ
jgi:hypothetical protein